MNATTYSLVDDRHPLLGVFTLTLAVANIFLVCGAIRFRIAFGSDRKPLFWVMVLSGALSIIPDGLIFADLPQTVLVSLGLLLGIGLMSNGGSLIALSRSRK